MASLSDRIIGVETEFGCLVQDESIGTSEQAVEQIKIAVFYDLKLGAIDMHARDEVFEPARSGGFLINGARLYIDAVGSHLEYATAETRNLRDLVAQDRAGQSIIVRAIEEAGLKGQVRMYNNSVDHFGGHTFGCHENYLARIDDEFFATRAEYVYGFLVTRQIFAGVGRVGGHVLSTNHRRPTYEEVSENPIDYIWVNSIYHVAPDSTVKFQLSQRADHILKTIASRVRFNRALINPKWEHYYSHEELQRLHILFGESNQNEYAYALKVGTTHLVLRLSEDGLLGDEHLLASPIWTLREVSRDETYEWPVMLEDGSIICATDFQRRYLALAEKHYRGQDDQTDWVLAQWASILDDLERDPLSLGDRLDWVAKRNMISGFVESEGLDWQDDVLHSLDLEYHNIDPSESLYHAIQPTQRYIDDMQILDAMTEPPVDTRAFGRSKLVRQAMEKKGAKFYVFDWSAAAIGRNEYFDLSDPYNPYENPVGQYYKS
ncbi:MAG: proteasome accessory factor PafA2 family protein [Armatimonadetes bacterium]|nr:proteasome accessory factor PafA2 family protein [Armatimonadota bacterium]